MHGPFFFSRRHILRSRHGNESYNGFDSTIKRIKQQQALDAHRISQVRKFHVYSISDQVSLGSRMLPVTFTLNNVTSRYKDLFPTGSHFDRKTQAFYFPSIRTNLNILCRSAYKPPGVSLLQLICCPDTKLSGKACLSSYGVESC